MGDVKQVVLNKSGKKAIRLDAWAKSTDDRHFNMEMQNNTSQDDMRKRSRYYQGLLDSPILKSGKETRYKHLPSTVIIFITQEDIFGMDRAQYTFSEQYLQNPDIIVKDERILELDDIVQEVKASEEWEAVKMSILEIGIEKGTEIGIQRGLQQKLYELVEKKLKKGLSVSEIAELLEEDESIITKIVEEIKKSI